MPGAGKTIARNPHWPGPAVSPGEMLREEFLKPLGIAHAEAARRVGISARGKRRVTVDTALRLSRLLKTSPQFWMRLQADWDVHRAVTPLHREGVMGVIMDCQDCQ